MAGWCLWFAVPHFLWALGWRWGVPDGQPSIADRPFFLAYDLAAGLLILGAAVVAVWLSIDESRLGRRDAARVLLIASVVAGARGLVGVLSDIEVALSGVRVPTVSAMADLWFVVAAILGVALWRRRWNPAQPHRIDVVATRR